MSDILPFLKPKSVAVVGASGDPSKVNGRPVAYLQAHNFNGDIYPINPRYEKIGDLACYPDAASLPSAPDMALVLVGAGRVVDAVKDLAARGTKAAIVLASGFGESGPEGQARQAALLEAAGDMRVLGPNTIGLVNLADGIMLTASAAMVRDDYPIGNVALISQSGGILGSLLSRAAGRGIGFSRLIATGNEVDVEVADFLSEMADDDKTDVVALYLETIRNVDAFRTAAEKVRAAGKRIVAYKVGRSEQGATAAISHTGALAGADEVYDAFFRQLGIIRAETFSELLDLPAALSSKRVMKGPNVAIVTSTGGAATIVADNIGLTDLQVPAPDKEAAEKLLALEIPDAVLDRNPIDVTMAGLDPNLFRQIIAILTESETYDALVMVVGSSSLGNPDLVAGPVTDALTKTDKPLMAYVSPDAPHIVQHLNKKGIPAFATPEMLAPALSALRPIAGSRPKVDRTPPPVDVGSLPSGSLNELDSKTLFSKVGIAVPQVIHASSAAEAGEKAKKFAAPVVLKIVSNEIQHKSEVGGVVVGVAPGDVGSAASDMLAAVAQRTSAKVDGVMIEEMIVGGVEMLLGFKRDPQLGPCIVLGGGGVTTELYRDVALRLLPVTEQDVDGLIDELVCSQLLSGFRGRPIADRRALVDAVLAFSDMIAVLGDRLIEAEINPLFVLPDGKGVRAGDALVVLG